jgi:hypothetical protein
MANQLLTLQIKSKYEQVCEKIHIATGSVGRRYDSVRLVVVTKTHPLDTVLAAIEAGIRDLGENYVEEAVAKITSSDLIGNVNWHMIGHVQSRKADLVARHFDFVHSVDSLKLASRLERFASENDRKLPILLECNVGGEESKFGFPAFNRADWPAIKKVAEEIGRLPHLEIHGLMTMPPLYFDSEQSRPFFKGLRELRDFLVNQVPQANWSELSMGTSVDFSAAIQEGATLVRIGTAILGSRPPQ